MCTAMLQDLLERGLRIDESILCVVDGGKGIRKALVDVLGDLAVIQRCHFHKLRNLRSYLPKSRHAYVLQTMKEAYKCKSADKARKQLRALVSWLERNGYDEAAGSLREGMEETLTVLKLDLPELLRRSLATTNAIENLNGTIRRVSRNVKRWKSPSMIRRWRTPCVRPSLGASREARGVMERFVEYYNGVRLHSAIGYIAPLDFMDGKAKQIWSERDRKLEQARQLRRERRTSKVPA